MTDQPKPTIKLIGDLEIDMTAHLNSPQFKAKVLEILGEHVMTITRIEARRGRKKEKK